MKKLVLLLTLLILFISGIGWAQRNEITFAGSKVCTGVYITTYAYGAGYSLGSSYFAPVTTMGLLNISRKSDPWHVPLCYTIPYKKSDYKNSGYDIGHFIPFKILSFCMDAIMESFSLGNASPQQKQFNEENSKWEGSEMRIIEVIKQLGDCSILCGVIYNKNTKTIGPDGLPVPDYYFKVCYFKSVGMVGIVGDNVTGVIRKKKTEMQKRKR